MKYIIILLILVIPFSLAAPQAQITEVNVETRMAPHTLFVHGTNSNPDGSWHRTQMEWDFDATNQESQHKATTDPRNDQQVNLAKDQQGYNAAYIYEQPGTYTVELRFTNENGETSTTTQSFTILPNTRTTYYVDPTNGNNANPGTSESQAWQTLNHAILNLPNNANLLLKRGEIFLFNDQFNIFQRNIVIDTYGSGNKPLLRMASDNDGFTPFFIREENVIIRNLELENPQAITRDSSTAITSLATAVTIENVDIPSDPNTVGFKRFLSSTPASNGLLFQNNNVGSVIYSNGFSPIGANQVYIGNTAGTSIDEHIMRVGFNPGMDNINLAWNHFDKGNIYKTVIRYQHVSFGYLYQNFFEQQETGQLIQIAFDGYRTEHIIIDGNRLEAPVGIELNPNARGVTIRNNLFWRESLDSGTGNLLGFGYSSESLSQAQVDEGGCEINDIDVVNNLFRDKESSTKEATLISFEPRSNTDHLQHPCRFGATPRRLSFTNNIIAPRSNFASTGESLLSIPDFSIFESFSNNVFPEYPDSYPYINAMNWQETLTQFPNQYREDPQFTTNNQPTNFDAQGIAFPGVFQDYNNNPRSSINTPGHMQLSTGPQECNNGQREGTETCDSETRTCTINNQQGTQNCNANCNGWETCIPSPTECGNNQIESGETCDDGNTQDGDGCSSTCHTEIQNPVCGNTQIESGETCDDGNTQDGDGCSSTCQTETQNPPTNLPQPIAHYPLDGNTQNTIDSNNAIDESGITYIQGNNGQAATFDETTDFISIPTTNWNIQSGTISFWVNPNPFEATRMYMFDHIVIPLPYNRIQIWKRNANGRIELGLGHDSILSQQVAQLIENQWSFITLTWENGNYNTYHNAQLTDSGTFQNFNQFNTFAVIGNDAQTQTQAFSGSIDDVKIFDSTLTQAQIQTVMNGCSTYDQDCDGSISIGELLDLITQWKNDQVTITEVLNAITQWKNG